MTPDQAITWAELNCNAKNVSRLRSRAVAATLLAEVRKLRQHRDALLIDLAESLEREDELKQHRDELQQILRDAYEVLAGSEGIPEPETCAEAYLLQLLVQMKDEIKRGLK